MGVPYLDFDRPAWSALRAATPLTLTEADLAELQGLNRRLDSGENLAPIVRELALLNDSLQALAYASLGQQGPQIRRRRAG